MAQLTVFVKKETGRETTSKTDAKAFILGNKDVF